ncbi:hypothetical protein MPL3356_90244 [Mesorhizobium plurifarium]|uniref:Uncharacterized protein n=1 Tax=Mesorhizobium plurifarium TaxID=69974 RepID=A0A090EFN9_MESPL|nr:hypothetical protein MPL3356_90244 [Mesorhizobium plurifarium]
MVQHRRHQGLGPRRRAALGTVGHHVEGRDRHGAARSARMDDNALIQRAQVRRVQGDKAATRRPINKNKNAEGEPARLRDNTGKQVGFGRGGVWGARLQKPRPVEIRPARLFALRKVIARRVAQAIPAEMNQNLPNCPLDSSSEG